ncbi:MAG TPA: hypothetical protein VFL36_13635 [Myxococcales bacterium]|nr:hypothetical protein [Myxococcales bacterium]
MNRVVALVLVLSLASPTWAQAVSAPPPPPDGESPPPPPPPQSPSEVSYYDSCFGVPRPGTGRFGIGGEVIVPLGGSSGGGGGPAPISLPSGSGDDRAWLLVAVLATAALPVVLYAVDRPAPRLVLQRFACPTFSLDLMGGAESGRNSAGSGLVSTRLSFGVSHVAADFQFDGASSSGVSAFATHVLLRITPKEHVDGGLAIGYRRSILDDRIQDGLEIGLPHKYALWREGLKTFALEIRPMLLFSSRVEPSLEASFLIPVAQVFHLRLGGRVYTFQGDLLWGVTGGINLTL